MKKIVALGLSLVMMFSLAACGSSSNSSTTEKDTTQITTPAETDKTDNTSKAKPTYTLKLSHCMSAKFSYQMFAEKFAELVNERTNGDVVVEIYPASQLGGERESCEAAQIGTLDLVITAAAPLANFTDEFEFLNLPFLFEDRAHAHEYLDSEYGDAKLASLEDVGLVGLAFGENEFFDWFTTFEATTPEEFSGKTIRCMENSIYMEYLSLLGVNPVPMAWSEVPTSMSNGTIDGTCLTLPGSWDLNMYSGNYFIKGDVSYGAVPLIMSKMSWDKLPEEYHSIFKESAKEAAAYEREWITENEKMMAEEMTAGGATLLEIDRDAFIDAIVEPLYSKHVGSTISAEDIDNVNAIRKTDPVYNP